jgi:hypothetical protein
MAYGGGVVMLMRLTRWSGFFVLFLFSGLVAAGAATESSHTEKSFPAAEAESVVVDVSFHDVEVHVRPGDTVDFVVDIRVSASGPKARRILGDYEPVFSHRNGELRMRSTRDGSSWGWVRAEGQVRVEMPPGMDLDVDGSSGECRVKGDLGAARVTCETSSGDIVVQGSARKVVADASSGDVEIRLSEEAESVRVSTSSGEVTVDGPMAELRVDTSSGDMRLRGLAGSADLGASSGDIEATWDRIPSGARVTANSSSGSVRFRFPAGTTLEGHVDTSSGRISSDFTGIYERHRMHFEGGPSAVRLVVDTSSGGVTLAER